MSQFESVIQATTKIPADNWEKVYYSGYVLSRLGLGDYIPSNDIWRLVTNWYAFTGLIFITMSVTYFIPVLTAVKEQKKLGINISGLGSSPQNMVVNVWNGENFNYFKYQLLLLSDALVDHNQNHRAYPIIHYFHNNKRKDAVVLKLAQLNEVIYLFQKYIRKEVTLDKSELLAINSALNNYTEVISEVSSLYFVQASDGSVPLNKLIGTGLLVDNYKEIPLDEEMRKRRMIFQTLVVQDGWNWEEVVK